MQVGGLDAPRVQHAAGATPPLELIGGAARQLVGSTHSLRRQHVRFFRYRFLQLDSVTGQMSLKKAVAASPRSLKHVRPRPVTAGGHARTAKANAFDWDRAVAEARAVYVDHGTVRRPALENELLVTG